MIDEVVEPEFFSNALPVELQRDMLKHEALVGLEPTTFGVLCTPIRQSILFEL